MPAAPPTKSPFDVLVCPLCGDALEPAGQSLRCPSRHTYDIARQGYVSLLGGNAHAPLADTAEMVQARTDFLGTGHYAPLVEELVRLARSRCPRDARVLDAGTGAGDYLAAVLDALPRACGLGLDASKYAVRRAARAHPRAAAATWDLWQPLPVRTGSVDLLLNVFAPRNGAEYRRVLRDDGALFVVTPTADHLAELRGPMGLLEVDEAKAERLERSLGGHFLLDCEEVVQYGMRLGAQDAANLVLMGPAARHRPAAEVRRAAAGLAPGVVVTASFRVGVYRPRSAP